MVGTGTGRLDEVVDGVRDIEGVVEAHIVAGEFDVMAEAVAEELCETLTGSSSVQKLEGVTEPGPTYHSSENGHLV